MKNKVEKQFNYKGLECVVVGLSMGHRCGYVGIPKDHKLFNVDYDDLYDLNVHGGLTYSGGESEYPIKSDLWWLGFDCAHHMDGKDVNLIKELNDNEQLVQSLIMFSDHEEQSVKTCDYVETELKQLVDQIIKMEAN